MPINRVLTGRGVVGGPNRVPVLRVGRHRHCCPAQHQRGLARENAAESTMAR